MDKAEIKKSMDYTSPYMIQYVRNAVVTKTILENPRGNISILSFDSADDLTKKAGSFYAFTQMVKGKAEIVIDADRNILVRGQSKFTPAHSPFPVASDQRFQMMVSVIKSGYQA